MTIVLIDKPLNKHPPMLLVAHAVRLRCRLLTPHDKVTPDVIKLLSRHASLPQLGSQHILGWGNCTPQTGATLEFVPCAQDHHAAVLQ